MVLTKRETDANEDPQLRHVHQLPLNCTFLDPGYNRQRTANYPVQRLGFLGVAFLGAMMSGELKLQPEILCVWRYHIMFSHTVF